MAEPATITLFRELLADESRPFCVVTTDGPFPRIGIRPELLTAHDDGRAVWSVNRTQAAKVLKQYDREDHT